MCCIMIQPFEYQKKCIEFIKHNRGLLLWHGTGTGKTICSLLMDTFRHWYNMIEIYIICTHIIPMRE